jgi:hypothetical protein
MSDQRNDGGDELTEEPQEERGAPGSRDKGDPEPAGGPTDRPAGSHESEDVTSVDPQETITDSPVAPGH